MPLLQCKQCGATMDYNRQEMMATCPYCDSQSKLMDIDLKLYEQFLDMMSGRIDAYHAAEYEEGFYVNASYATFTRDDGEVVEAYYYAKRKMDVCTAYICQNNLLMIFDNNHTAYAKKYEATVSSIKYPNEEMERVLSQFIPHIVACYRLEDGGMLIALEKKQDVYPLKMLGMLLDRHVAWIISRLENLCCLLEFNGIVHNGINVNNLYVDAKNHQIYLLGGWWFSGFTGEENHNRTKNRIADDLMDVRRTSANLLGYANICDIQSDTLLPADFKSFLLNDQACSAMSDFSYWDTALIKSFGERKFIPLNVTNESIYAN